MAEPTKWIVGLAAIVFDVDVGQRLDQSVGLALTEEEKASISFHSFPDSRSLELHAKTSVRDTCFWFRVKRTGVSRRAAQAEGQQPPKGAAAPDPFLYGYVFCRQRQDETLRRGGEQVSVVVLAEHPFSSVLRPLSQVAGPLYFTHGVQALQQVYQEVCAWPPPTAAGLLQLQVSFNTLSGRLPPFDTLPHPSCGMAVDMGLPSSRSGTLGRLSHASIPDALVPPGHGFPLRKPSGGSILGEGSISGSLFPGPGSRLSGELMLGPPDPRTSGQGSDAHACDQALGQGAPHVDGVTHVEVTGDTSVASGEGSTCIQAPTQAGSEVQGNAGLTGLPPLKGGGRMGDMLVSHASNSPTMWAAHAPGVSLGQHVTMRSVSRASLHSADSQGSLNLSGPLEGARHTTQGSGQLGQGGSGSLSAAQLNLQGPGGSPVRLHTNGSGGLQQQHVLPVMGGGLGPAVANPNVLPRRLSTSLLDLGGVAVGAFCDSDVFTPLQPHLARLWQLWELVLLARPLLVVGPSPADCSGAVAALISLVAPLPYAPDFRPYYTIHDGAFGALAGGALPGPHQRSVPCLMGVTNLYFVKALTHWPNILSVGRKETGNSWAPDAAPASSTAMAAMMSAAGAVKAMRQRSQGAQALLGGHVEAFWSTYKPVTKPDQTLLVRLLQAKPGDAKSKLSRIAAVNTEALRRHFQELMAAFLAPFGRYFEAAPDGWLPAWDEAEFLFTIRSPTVPPPPVLLDRVGGLTSNLVELYARFVTCVNFRDWFTLCRRRLQHLEAPALAPQMTGLSLRSRDQGLAWFGLASKHMDEVQLINLYAALEGQLREAEAEADASEAEPDAVETKTRLQRELTTLFLGIGQQDLQLLCISAPSRRDLLLSAAQQVCTPDKLKGIQELAAMLN